MADYENNSTDVPEPPSFMERSVAQPMSRDVAEPPSTGPGMEKSGPAFSPRHASTNRRHYDRRTGTVMTRAEAQHMYETAGTL
jgi:hypothetical protein